LNIPVNILHVCQQCHDHNNIQFLDDARMILKERVDALFEDKNYGAIGISIKLEMTLDEVDHQMQKGFLQHEKDRWISSKEQIMRWLGVKM